MDQQEDKALTTELTFTDEVKLYYDLFAPHARPAPLLIALHGYGSNKGWMMREARLLAPSGFSIVSLQGFHQHIKEPKFEGGPMRYGFGWGTNFHPEDSIALHHHAINHLVGSLTCEGMADPERVFLLGFSQSVALNYRFAFTYPEVLRGVIAVCGGIPGDWETSERYRETDAEIFHLHGTRDEFYPPARVSDYETRLRSRARNVKIQAYDAAHELTAAMRDDIREWLTSLAGPMGKGEESA